MRASIQCRWFFASAVVVLASILACSSNSEPVQLSPTADIEKLSETATTLKMKFTDSQNDQLVIDFERVGGAGGFWKPTPQISGDQHIFGEQHVVLPSVDQIVAQGWEPTEFLSTFDGSAANVFADEISIFSIRGIGLAIVVWERAAVSHVYLAGTDVVDEFILLAQEGSAAQTACQGFSELCAQEASVVPCTSANASYCTAAARVCTGDEEDTACTTLTNLCLCDPADATDNNPDACAGLAECDDPPPDTGPTVEEILLWILQVLEEILRQITAPPAP